MWRGNRDYLLCLRFCVLGRTETVLLRHAERNACSWTTSTPWLRHRNAERWGRDKQWYRNVSQRNVGTTWKTISIFCKILPFLLRLNLKQTSFFSGVLWLYILAASSGIPWRINWSLNCKESTISTPLTAAFLALIYDLNLKLNQILACGSSNATLSEQLAERIQSSGLGMIIKWAPQQFILNHLVCYYFSIVTCPGSIFRIP